MMDTRSANSQAPLAQGRKITASSPDPLHARLIDIIFEFVVPEPRPPACSPQISRSGAFT